MVGNEYCNLRCKNVSYFFSVVEPELKPEPGKKGAAPALALTYCILQ